MTEDLIDFNWDREPLRHMILASLRCVRVVSIAR